MMIDVFIPKGLPDGWGSVTSPSIIQVCSEVMLRESDVCGSAGPAWGMVLNMTVSKGSEAGEG